MDGKRMAKGGKKKNKNEIKIKIKKHNWKWLRIIKLIIQLIIISLIKSDSEMNTRNEIKETKHLIRTFCWGCTATKLAKRPDLSRLVQIPDWQNWTRSDKGQLTTAKNGAGLYSHAIEHTNISGTSPLVRHLFGTSLDLAGTSYLVFLSTCSDFRFANFVREAS